MTPVQVFLRVARALKRALKMTRARLFYSGSRHCCIICGRRARKFFDQSNPPRRNIKCPFCDSFDRHRLDWVFFQRSTDLFDGSPKRMLHIAPEYGLADRFRRIPGVDYVSGDLNSPRAMVKMDITAIQYPDNHFSVIYCSHVLEHVPDDRKALAEFFRVLAPGGWAVLQVPIRGRRTWEDLGITDPDERTRLFGQADHVRNCGPDYVERMRDAGFDAEVIRAGDVLTQDELTEMAIPETRLVFFCRKLHAAA